MGMNAFSGRFTDYVALHAVLTSSLRICSFAFSVQKKKRKTLPLTIYVSTLEVAQCAHPRNLG